MSLTPNLLPFLLVGCLLIVGCDKKDKSPAPTHPVVDREDKIPVDISKRVPHSDPHPPILHSLDYEEPIPLSSSVNTAGAEDSPFVLPDGNTLYFFFTPDVRVPANGQLLDEVSGVWVSKKTSGTWGAATRVWLTAAGTLALDGAVSIDGSEMWFASAREGYTGVNMFTAQWTAGTWENRQYSGDRLMKELQIGEVHLQGNDLYFHSSRSGGKGDYDIWVTTRDGNSWSDPVNIDIVNTTAMDGFPFVSSDGNELWFTRTYGGTPGIFRSSKVNGAWSAPELILSQFAGEPTLDDSGNIYFVHHFYENDVMIEVDIYVAYRK